jgi:hypothetical protein
MPNLRACATAGVNRAEIDRRRCRSRPVGAAGAAGVTRVLCHHERDRYGRRPQMRELNEA